MDAIKMVRRMMVVDVQTICLLSTPLAQQLQKFKKHFLVMTRWRSIRATGPTMASQTSPPVTLNTCNAWHNGEPRYQKQLVRWLSLKASVSTHLGDCLDNQKIPLYLVAVAYIDQDCFSQNYSKFLSILRSTWWWGCPPCFIFKTSLRSLQLGKPIHVWYLAAVRRRSKAASFGQIIETFLATF